MSRERRTQCLIIGGGIAGLSAAIAAAEKGIEVTVISSAFEKKESNTLYAQGGIIYQALNEKPESLENDIMEAGCHANYRPAVTQLVKMGPELVRKILLEKVRVPFDVEAGTYALTREGAHSESRILHRGDQSGMAIEEALLAYVEKLPSVKILVQHTAVNLLMTSYHAKDKSSCHEEARCFGAFVYDQNSKEVYPILADHTIICTGGIGQLFLHHTNSKFARGDGIALAYRAGCRMADLEYIQFHPTTFFHPGSRRFLISEALRGEGGLLVNQAGQRFLSKYLSDYETPELAPRDKVAKAIHQEMLSTGTSCVYLDLSFKDSEWIKKRFPFVYHSCAAYDVDISREPIPVVPAAHYSCGGVWVNLNGETSVSHLWAAGEVSCTGLHGANRLASTSLLEGLVWGTRAGESIAELVKSGDQAAIPEIDDWKNESARVDSSFLSQDWLTLKNTMWNYVGLIKTEARLKRAQGILTELSRGIDVFYRKAALSDELIGLRHASLVALLILDACMRNSRSLGCYLREDLEI